MTCDPYAALDTLIELGVDRVLTSGQEASVLEGLAVVRALVACGADILELRPERPTLERIYFEVMGVTPGADALEDHV